jgi:tripartite-type tricarboxylate transporter receptor subunit TctC
MYSNRTIVRLLASCLALFTAGAAAQAYPVKPVRLIVGFAAGGPADATARMLADKLGTIWGQTVVVDNRGGAGGTIASGLAAKSAPDGYTLLLAASSVAYDSALFRNLPYDGLKDFTPISMAASYAPILVTPTSLPVNNLRELVAYAKANPGKVAYGSSGGGSGSHLSAELFRRAAGIELLHVPYKGAALATGDLMSGQLQMMFQNPVSVLPLVKSGKLRGIATTGLKRSATAPDLPTVAESGYPGFETEVWFAFVGPAGLPRDIVNKVAADAAAVLKMADVRQRLAAQGLEANATTPEQLAAIMRADFEKWSGVIRAANIRAD